MLQLSWVNFHWWVLSCQQLPHHFPPRYPNCCFLQGLFFRRVEPTSVGRTIMNDGGAGKFVSWANPSALHPAGANLWRFAIPVHFGVRPSVDQAGHLGFLVCSSPSVKPCQDFQSVTVSHHWFCDTIVTSGVVIGPFTTHHNTTS